jgi:hypothetical protein
MVRRSVGNVHMGPSASLPAGEDDGLGLIGGNRGYGRGWEGL